MSLELFLNKFFFFLLAMNMCLKELVLFLPDIGNKHFTFLQMLLILEWFPMQFRSKVSMQTIQSCLIPCLSRIKLNHISRYGCDTHNTGGTDKYWRHSHKVSQKYLRQASICLYKAKELLEICCLRQSIFYLKGNMTSPA